MDEDESSLDLRNTSVESILEAPSRLLIKNHHLSRIPYPLTGVENLVVQGDDEGVLFVKDLLRKFPRIIKMNLTSSWPVDWVDPREFLSSTLEKASFQIDSFMELNLPVSTPKLKNLTVWSRPDCRLDVEALEDMSLTIQGKISPKIHSRGNLNLLDLRVGGSIDVHCGDVNDLSLGSEKFYGEIHARTIGCVNLLPWIGEFSLSMNATVRRVDLLGSNVKEIFLNSHILSLERDEVLTLPLSRVDDLVVSDVSCSTEENTLYMNVHHYDRDHRVVFRFSVERVHVCTCRRSHRFRLDAKEVHFHHCPDCEENVDWWSCLKKRNPPLNEEMGRRLVARRIVGKKTSVFHH